jgi:hypothetical protein
MKKLTLSISRFEPPSRAGELRKSRGPSSPEIALLTSGAFFPLSWAPESSEVQAVFSHACEACAEEERLEGATVSLRAFEQGEMQASQEVALCDECFELFELERAKKTGRIQ